MSWIGDIISFMSCSDLYKYVLNSMTCHSDCCHHDFLCDCETTKIDIPSDSDDDLGCCLRGGDDPYLNSHD